MQQSTEMRRLLEQVRATPGWTVEETRRGWMCIPPAADMEAVLITSSIEHRAFKNMLAALRRSGWNPEIAEAAKAEDRKRRLAAATKTAVAAGPAITPASTPPANGRTKGTDMPRTSNGVAGREETSLPARAVSRAPSAANRTHTTVAAPATRTDTAPQILINTARGASPAVADGPASPDSFGGWPVPRVVDIIDTREMDDPETDIPALLKQRQDAAPGIVVELWLITPLAALVLHAYRDLETAAGYKHRAVTADRVKRYRADMVKDEWLLTHQGLAFNSQGQLIDGQHRMEALTDAEVSDGVAPFMITFNLEPHVMPTVDTGRTRTGGDALTAGGISSGGAVAAALRLTDLYLSTVPHNAWSRETYTPQRVFTLVDKYPEMDKAIKDSAPIRKIGANPSAAATFVYLVRREWPAADLPDADGNPSLLTQFIDGTATGYGLEPGDARGALRNYALNSNARVRRQLGGGSMRSNRTVRREQAEWLAVLLRAWAGWLTNTKVRQLSWKPTVEELPGVCNPTIPGKNWKYRAATVADTNK